MVMVSVAEAVDGSRAAGRCGHGDHAGSYRRAGVLSGGLRAAAGSQAGDRYQQGQERHEVEPREHLLATASADAKQQHQTRENKSVSKALRGWRERLQGRAGGSGGYGERAGCRRTAGGDGRRIKGAGRAGWQPTADKTDLRIESVFRRDREYRLPTLTRKLYSG